MMSTGFMAAEHASFPLGGSLAVFAAGPVGLMAIQGAKLLGAVRRSPWKNVPHRQALARR